MNIHDVTRHSPFYRKVPALAAYIDRIGAKEKNFRRWMVQEDHGHYYKEKCVIKIDADGAVTVTKPEYAPTADEQAKISRAYADGIELPRSIEQRPAALQNLLSMLRAEHREHAVNADGDPDFFVFINQANNNILMVQQRIDTVDGKKYLPWSHWSDAVWRCMEPDGGLPFWKPPKTDLKNIMTHEGAKSAQAAQAIADDPNSTHPWAAEFRKFEHWGMIGGALSAHRADYSELKARNPELVVYICDNDQPGKAAAPIVSKHYRGRMEHATFDSSFPPHWDAADPMPKAMFAPDGRYIGKPLNHYMRSSTWATDPLPLEKGKKQAYRINQPFADEWLTCRQPDQYVHNNLPRNMLSRDEFNKWVQPYSDVDDTAKLLNRREECLAAGLRYDPRSPSGRAAGGSNENFINTYMPADIKPLEGDCAPWEAFLEHLFPYERDRTEVIRWISTLVVKPDVKMNYGLLLISEEQGVGKSTLGSDVLRHLVGEWNYYAPTAQTVCESNFNGWAAHKRLAVIHEVYDDFKSKSYERLKSLITEPTISVNKKYQSEYTIENWLHVIACSNHKRALKIGIDDRRWLVPRVAEAKRSQEEWDAFHAWLADDGLRKIRWWLERWLQSNAAVARGANAPFTATKKDVIRDNYSPGQEMTATFLEWLVERQKEQGDTRPLIVLDVDLQTMVSSEHHNRQHTETTGTLRKVAKTMGWVTVEQRVQIKPWRRHVSTKALTNAVELAKTDIEDLKAMADRGEAVLVDVAALAREWRGL